MIWLVNNWRVLVIVGVIAAIGGAYLVGKRDGRADVAIKAAAQIERAWKDRGKIDDKVQNMDSVSICVELGGVLADCQQLRRVD